MVRIHPGLPFFPPAPPEVLRHFSQRRARTALVTCLLFQHHVQTALVTCHFSQQHAQTALVTRPFFQLRVPISGPAAQFDRNRRPFSKVTDLTACRIGDALSRANSISCFCSST